MRNICVLKMSKYMWRMVDAIKILKEMMQWQEAKGATVDHTQSASLVRFERENNPEVVMRIL